MAMITAAAWVPRGFAAPFPSKYTLSEEEFARISELANIQLEDANKALEEAQQGAQDEAAEMEQLQDENEGSKKGKSATHDNDDVSIDEDLKEYDLDTYDDDDDDEPGQSFGSLGNFKSHAYYKSNKEDPYMTVQDDEEDGDEREDLQILATDNLLIAAKIEDEISHLEVYVYEDQADNLYVHHDLMLPDYTLCVERLDFPVGRSGAEKDSGANFVAIGGLDPTIEIWDLDIVDCMYPNAILGPPSNADGIKKGKKKKQKANDQYHVDAVLSLAANRKHRNLLASASADKTIKLWDLNTVKCAKSYSYHTDKVCSLAWHAVESTVLLSGSYDHTVAAADMRAPNVQPTRVGVESDVETVRWDPHDANYFFVSTENGLIHYYDIRNASTDPSASKSVWKLQAHDESISAFDINPVIPGFIATGSTDKTVKLWNISSNGPSMVVSRDFDVGKVFVTAFAPDPEVAFRLAVAGSKGTLTVWDTSTNPAVRKAFGDKVPSGRGVSDDVEDRLVGVNNDEEPESSDEDEGEGEEEEGDEMDED